MTPRQFKAWRIWSGLKHDDICAMAGFTRPVLSQYEQGGHATQKTVDKLLALVDASEAGFLKDGSMSLPE